MMVPQHCGDLLGVAGALRQLPVTRGASVAACLQQVFMAQKLTAQELFSLLSSLLRSRSPDLALVTAILITNKLKQEEISLWNTSVSVEGCN